MADERDAEIRRMAEALAKALGWSVEYAESKILKAMRPSGVTTHDILADAPAIPLESVLRED